MSVEPQKFEAPGNEIQHAEAVAGKLSDLADKARVEEEKYSPEARYKEEWFSDAGRETAQGNFDGAQRILENDSFHDETFRGAIFEINQLDRERRGAKPMQFENAKQVISGYANDLRKKDENKDPEGVAADFKSAMALDSIADGTSKPGVEGIDVALKYIEDIVKVRGHDTDASIADPTRKATKMRDLEEKRDVRDALYTERLKRIEELKQSERAAGEVTGERNGVTAGLERLYARAGVPEDAPSRNEFFGRVGSMSAEELRLLDSALKQAVREAARSSDPGKMLGGLLMDLGGKSFKLEDVKARDKIRSEEKIRQLRQELGAESEPGKTPTAPETIDKTPESPEERFGKFLNYEKHKESAGRIVRSLKAIKDVYEASNNTQKASEDLSYSLADFTPRAVPEDMKKLRGQPIDIEKEKLQFGISDEAIDDYKRAREFQNALSEGKSIQESSGNLEKQLEEAYGISQIDLRDIRTIEQARLLNTSLVAEITNDPALKGKIKEVLGVGYQIPSVPSSRQSANGELEIANRDHTSSQDVGARPTVVVYRYEAK